jgi:cytochrome c-type biogenesis protein CcmH/NrfG
VNENLERGIELLRKALGSRPGNSESWLKLANALIAAQRPSEVVDVFCDLVSALPNRPQMHYDLLSGLVERGPHYAATRRVFEDAASRSGAVAAVYYGLGLVFQIAHEPQRALKYFDQALQEDPRLAAVHYNKSVIFLAPETLSQAAAAAETAVRQAPNMAEPHYLLGTVCVDQARLREALAHFEAFVAMARTPELALYANDAALKISLLREQLPG